MQRCRARRRHVARGLERADDHVVLDGEAVERLDQLKGAPDAGVADLIRAFAGDGRAVEGTI